MNMPVSSERKRSKAGCVSQKKVLIALVLMLVVCGSSLLFGDDVTDAVRLNRGRPFYDYASGQTYTTVSLQNTSSEPVSAPIKLVVTSISTLLVSVSDPDGTTPDGAPYLDFSSELGDQVLSPAETSANRTLRFDNADRQRFSFAWRIVTEAATPAHPPELGPVEDAVMEEGQSLEIPVTATDPDGDVVALRVAPLPAFASFIDHGNNAGTLALAPGYEDAGAYTLVCTAEDPGGLTDTGELEVTVQHVNRPPTADDQDITTDEDAATEIMLTGHDPDQDDLIFIIVEQPVKGVLTGEAPGLVYTPAAEFSGEDGFIFKVNDGTVDSDVARVTIRVDAVADPPIADAGADQRAFIGEEVTLNGSASHDPEGAPLRYHWTLLRAPTGSAATLRDAATAAPSLDIDRHGTYGPIPSW